MSEATNTPKPGDIGVNFAFEATIDRDPNLSLGAKALFHQLASDADRIRNQALSDFQCYAELIHRNYIFIEGFPASMANQKSNRTSFQLRVAGLKQFFTGKPE
jgi:hypothetical protein